MRIPREFELPGDEAIMRREGGRLIIEPAMAGSLVALLATLEPIEDDFELPPDHPPEAVDFRCRTFSTRADRAGSAADGRKRPAHCRARDICRVYPRYGRSGF